MFTKKSYGWGLVLMFGAMLAVVPAAAADQSDVAGRTAIWEKEYNAGNLAAVQALYAADGCRMPPNQAAAHGSAAILAQLKAGKEQGLAKVKIVVTTAESNGDLGYGTGTYVITAGAPSTMASGCWCRKSRMGHGRLSADVFNSDMPMPAMK